MTTARTKGHAAAPAPAKAKKETAANDSGDDKPTRKPKTNFLTTNVAKEQLNADGKFAKAPEGFDVSEHMPLKGAQFADDVAYMEHRANVAQQKADGFLQRANELRERANELRKYGDPATRKKVERRRKLKAQLAELDSALEAEGIEVDAS